MRSVTKAILRAFVSSPVLLAGCASSTIHLYSSVDPNEKTMIVPPGDALLVGRLKDGLNQAGWRLSVDNNQNTRYKLILNQHQFDVCVGTLLPMVSYDLSVIDIRSGEEVMTQSGNDCVDLAAKWFNSAISCGGEGFCASSTGRLCTNTLPCVAKPSGPVSAPRSQVNSSTPANGQKSLAEIAVPVGPNLANQAGAASSSVRTIPMKQQNGIYVVQGSINDAITLDFIIDSGATDVSIPGDVVLTLMRTGTLTANDFLGARTYVLANGSKFPSATFRIRSLKVGDEVVDNVIGSVGDVRGSLLLGQSFLERFKSWSIDNKIHAFVVE